MNMSKASHALCCVEQNKTNVKVYCSNMDAMKACAHLWAYTQKEANKFQKYTKKNILKR